jgi:hypothetical protein
MESAGGEELPECLDHRADRATALVEAVKPAALLDPGEQILVVHLVASSPSSNDRR